MRERERHSRAGNFRGPNERPFRRFLIGKTVREVG
jgi:hypothetical protein